ncbi:MAG: restriction endonuclease subunit S [Cyclobacteriaceae bacterium]
MPQNWKTYKLGEVAKIKYGKDHKKLDAGSIPCIGTGGVMRYVDSFLSEKESVLIPRKGSLNNIY